MFSIPSRARVEHLRRSRHRRGQAVPRGGHKAHPPHLHELKACCPPHPHEPVISCEVLLAPFHLSDPQSLLGI